MLLNTVTDRSYNLLRSIKQRLAIRTNLRYCVRQLRKTKFGIEVVRNWYWDRRFGGDCGGTIKSHFDHLGARDVQSTYYSSLPWLFQHVTITASDVLVDIGCGKGRVINYWLSLGYKNRIVGIELDPAVAAEAKERLKDHANVTIIAGNALEHVPPDGTIFYLFNPFYASVWEQLKAIMVDLFAGRRNITIVYNNCLHLDVFKDDPDWTVQELGMLVSGPAAIVKMNSPRNAPSAPTTQS